MSQPRPLAESPCGPIIQRPPSPRITPRAPSEVVDLDDDTIPVGASITEEFERGHLVQSLVTKYRDEV